MDQPQSRLAWVGSRLLLSFLAVFAGWAAGGLLFLCASVGTKADPASTRYLLLMYAVAFGVLSIGVWLIVAFPISLFVPSHSRFWQPARLALIGIAISEVLGTPYNLWENYHSVGSWVDAATCIFFYAVIGGIIGYVAAILNRRFTSPSRHSA